MNERLEFALIAGLMALPLLTTACDRAAESKESEFKMVADSLASTNRELCGAAESAASAWLTRQDSERYAHWKAEAERYCGLNDIGLMFPPRSGEQPK